MSEIAEWHYDVIIAGGGIAGLTAAALAARDGRTVALFEQSENIGGRATTRDQNGFLMNLGPHALYRSSHADNVLQELGIEINAPKVGQSGAVAVRLNAIHKLPGSITSLLTTTMFSFSAKLQTAGILSRIEKIDPAPLNHTSIGRWIEQQSRRQEVRDLLSAVIRVATYSNAPDLLSAGAALGQLQSALRGGVSYLSGGWSTLVERLAEKAAAAGAMTYSGIGVKRLLHRNGLVEGVELSDGCRVRSDAVILALPPKAALSVLGDAAGPRLSEWLDHSVPVQAASLDLGLRKLPNPNITFALGMDRPLYFSVHSRWAKLAPADGAMIHVLKYLPCRENRHSSGGERDELERLVDLVQPGWRSELVTSRFLPRLTVTGALADAVHGGLAGRPPVNAAEVRGVYLAGDWVGSQGMLADASFASARKATEALRNARATALESQMV